MTAFVLLVSCIGVYGQHSIKGTILESMSKQPLKEVLIRVKNTALTEFTDLKGNFLIKNFQGNKAILEIKLVGYATQNIPIELTDTILDLGIIVYLILKSVFF